MALGFVNANDVRQGAKSLVPLGWEALGQVVQRRTLDAVAEHFLAVGLAELCMDALAKESAAPAEVVRK